MYYIVETEEQLNRLYCKGTDCYIRIIPMNEEYHSALTSPCLVYFRTFDNKGYIFPINHSEAFKLPFEKVLEWIESKYEKIYTINKKECLYHFDSPKLIDVSYDDSNMDYSLIRSLSYDKHGHLPFCNSLVPISKIYETEEKVFEEIREKIPTEVNDFYNDTFPRVFKLIEEQGLKVHPDYFEKHFKYHDKSWFYHADTVYSKYNLYNLTTRPTNSFNGVNFAALNKNDGSRTAFIPKNDMFFEFDYDAYHVRIMAKLINFPLDRGSVHTQLGCMYFGKDKLTPEEYTQSKELTFKQLYGGVFKEYREIPFFKAMNEYIDKLWALFNATGKLELVGGKILDKEQIQNPTPNKVLNYVIQSAETHNNVISVKQVIEYLENQQSKVILYTYDSFLIDYALSDGKKVLKEIKKLLEINGYVVKVAYGLNYNSLKEI